MNRLASLFFSIFLVACGAGPSGVGSTASGTTSANTTSTGSGSTGGSGGSGSTSGSHLGRTAPFDNLSYGARGALLVGPEGGVLSSEHGGMALTILPGTFQTPTEIAITEATHPLGDGGAEILYELEPAGLQFPDFAHRPIATYYLDPSRSVYGSIASFYDDQGKPQVIYNSWTDEATHCVQAPLPHFSDHFVTTVTCAQAPTSQRLLTGTTSKWYFACLAELPSNTGPIVEDLGVGSAGESSWLKSYKVTFTLNGARMEYASPNDGTISVVHQGDVPAGELGYGLYTAPAQISARNQTVSWGSTIHIVGVDKSGTPFTYDNAFQFPVRIVSRKWRIRLHWYHNPVCGLFTSPYSTVYDSDVNTFFTMSAGSETPDPVSIDYDYSYLFQTHWSPPRSCVLFFGVTELPMPQVGLSVSAVSGSARFEQNIGEHGVPNDSATFTIAATWKSDIAVHIIPPGGDPYDLFTEPPSSITAPTQFLPHLVSGARITHEEPNGNHAGYLLQFDEVQ